MRDSVKDIEDIQYLIAGSLFVPAKRLWKDAVAHAKFEAIPRLCLDVAEAWLAKGVWYEARAVMDSYPHANFCFPSLKRTSEIEDLMGRITQMQMEEDQKFEDFLVTQMAKSSRWEQATNWWRSILSISAIEFTDNQRKPLPCPAAADGEDGPVFTWSHPDVILTMEFVGEKGIEWSAFDRFEKTTAQGTVPVGLTSPELDVWMKKVRGDEKSS